MVAFPPDDPQSTPEPDPKPAPDVIEGMVKIVLLLENVSEQLACAARALAAAAQIIVQERKAKGGG